MDAHSASSPLGTGIGGGYGADDKIMIRKVLFTRYNRSARYDSPVTNGLKFSALYAPGNDEASSLPGAYKAENFRPLVTGES